MNDYLNTLKERGFTKQLSNEDGISDYLDKKTTAYIGFDPTATSLHVGSLVPIMALAHFQRAGHTPLVLVGGATAMIGDPSGKNEMRQMLTEDDIQHNLEQIKKQLSRFISFDNDEAIMLNNADWLRDLNYIDFLRNTGKFFSVNRMIAAESAKKRLENGLSFIEFNYMIFQAYDFLELSKKYDCLLEMGGNDQWGNIVAGIDLIRRVKSKEAYGLTFPLITTSNGNKMGKTASGAVWLDPKKTSPYDYYQFWRNTEDDDVKKFLSLFTFLPMKEINKLGDVEGVELNEAKKVLAFEATKIAHGEKAAKEVADWKQNMPEIRVSSTEISEGITALDIFMKSELFASKGEARRLIKQGGGYINEVTITEANQKIKFDNFKEEQIIFRAGKKKYFRAVKNG